MSQETVLNTLVNFGLTQIEAQIYIFLAKKGALKGRNIRKALKITKQQLYPSLRNLQNKGIVSSTLEHPARFSSLPFEKVLDLFIKTKVEETQRLQQSKDEILSKWQTFEIVESETPGFMVIEGRNYIFSRIRQMIDEAKKQISTITTVSSLIQADQYDLFNAEFNHSLKSKIKFRFLTELSSQNSKAIKKLLRETSSAKLDFEGRNPDLGLRLFPRMVIRDEDEALFFIRPRTVESIIERDDVCLWTNCKTLVKAFTAIFEELWSHSTDMGKKIVEIETGKPPPKVYSISNSEKARKKFDEAMQIAKEEIILLTSSDGITRFWKQKVKLKKLTEKGVDVKIMAPILRGNAKEAKQLSRFCEVRHVPINYWKTLIVDEKYLLQFRAVSQDEMKPKIELPFKGAFYTEDPEYLKMMKKALYDIWKKAEALSTARLGATIQPFRPPVVPLPSEHIFERARVPVIDLKPPGMMTEEEVLSKFIKGKKIHVKDISKDKSRLYGSMAMAFIQPPNHINLPKIMIQATHVENWSSLGGGCHLIVHSSLETPTGQTLVPVAVLLQRGNPQEQAYFEMFLAGSPAAQNIQLVQKDELQVRVHGNTVFAGWTVPIKLFPLEQIIQPGCLLVEGYGDVETSGSTAVFPSGVKAEIEGNYFGALVTFIQPSYNYSGPGTEGLFAREYIMTKHPPQNSGKPAT